MAKNDSILTAFATMLKAWPKEAGPKVTAAELEAASVLVKRQGTAKHMGAAMALRAGGTTQGQVLLVTGDTQLNVLRDAVNGKQAKYLPMEKRGTHKVYRIELVTKKARQPKVKAQKAATVPATQEAGGDAAEAHATA